MIDYSVVRWEFARYTAQCAGMLEVSAYQDWSQPSAWVTLRACQLPKVLPVGLRGLALTLLVCSVLPLAEVRYRLVLPRMEQLAPRTTVDCNQEHLHRAGVAPEPAMRSLVATPESVLHALPLYHCSRCC